MLSQKPFEVPPYLLARAKSMAPARVAIAGADTELALRSARVATQAGICEPILVGEEARIRDLAAAQEWDISGFDVVPASSEAEASFRAVAQARHGAASVVMKGHVHTNDLMRAVLDRAQGLFDGRWLSHVFHMTVPDCDRVLFITDAAVNVEPDADAMIHILNNAAELAHMLGNERPNVAVLSATESHAPEVPSSLLAREVVTRAAAGEVPGAVVGGPFALDNAISPEAVVIKGIDHPVAGRADILAVPNIETGNGLCKAMVWFMSATAAGIVMGAKVPVVLTSRADPPEARLTAVIIATLLSGSK